MRLCSVELNAGVSKREDAVSFLPEVGAGEEMVVEVVSDGWECWGTANVVVV